MCNCGEFLEMYKEDMTFRIQSPESVDPDETNPNAPWVTSQTSNIGSSSPIVARVLLQGKALLESALLEGNVDKKATIIHLHACKESLLACQKIADTVSKSINSIIAQISEHGVRKENNGRGLNPFPQVQDLNTDCGNFLVQVNRTIRLICELPGFFYSLERPDSNFEHLSRRLSAAIDGDSPILKFLNINAEAVRYLIDLRNFHEHPKEIRTIIENFKVLPNGNFQVPVWYLADGKPAEPCPIMEDMIASVHFLTELTETMLIHLVMQRINSNFPFVLPETPEEELNPAIPIKYRLGLGKK